MLLPKIFGNVGALVFAPVVSFEHWFRESGSTIPVYFRDRKELTERIAFLEQQLDIKEKSEAALDLLLREDEELRNLVGEATSSRIVADVIGRPSETPYDVLILDRGTSDGVMEFAPVYVLNNQVVGFVAAAYQDSAIVVLATTPEVESTVYIFGPNIYTTAYGMGGGVLRVSVPQGIQITIGDIVALPSFGGGMFGYISHVESVPADPEQHGFVTLPVSLQSLRTVSVGIEPVVVSTFEDAKHVIDNLRTELFSVPVPEGVLVDTVGTSTDASSTPEQQTENE